MRVMVPLVSRSWRKRVGVEPTKDRQRPPPGLKSGRPTGGDPLTPVDSGPRVPVRGGSDTVTRSAPERIGIDLARVLKDPKFRDNVILVGGDSVNILEPLPLDERGQRAQALGQ